MDDSIKNKLTKSIIENDYKQIEIQLERCDPNGYNHGGIDFKSPLSQLYNLKKDKKKWLKKFILKGGNLNKMGLDNKTLLLNELTEVKDIDYDFIHHLLIKGSNPNIPEYNLPLNILCKKYKKDKSLYKLICLLITFGGNIYKEDVNFIAPIKYLNNNPITFEHILELKEPYMINQLKCICKTSCIKELKEIIHTKKRVPYKNLDKKLEKCFNKTTLLGDCIKNYSNNELLIYSLDKNIWCFHMNSLSTILQSKKNPWTNQKMSSKSLDHVYDEFHYVPAIHTDNIKDYINPQKENFTNKKLLSIVSGILKSFNHYIPCNMISTIPAEELYHLSRTIINHCGHMHFIHLFQHRQTLVSTFQTKSHDAFIRVFLKTIVKLVQSKFITLSMLCYIIERTMNSFDTLLYIRDLLKLDVYNMIRNIILHHPTIPFTLENLSNVLNETQMDLIQERIKISNYIENDEDLQNEWLSILKMIIRNRF